MIGRYEEPGWHYVQEFHHKYPCWLKTELAKADSGNIDNLLIKYSMLSCPDLDQPPDGDQAFFSSNEVTVTKKTSTNRMNPGPSSREFQMAK